MFRSDFKHPDPLTPVGQIKFLLDDVMFFTETGILSDDQGSVLTTMLEDGIKQLDQNNFNGTITRLKAFIGEINAEIRKGVLSKREGRGLVDAANDANMIIHESSVSLYNGV